MQVIRIQPNESIYLKINNKVPGLGLSLDTQRLDLSYDQTYKSHLPDAYERLILDVINGDKRLFIRADELEVHHLAPAAPRDPPPPLPTHIHPKHTHYVCWHCPRDMSLPRRCSSVPGCGAGRHAATAMQLGVTAHAPSSCPARAEQRPLTAPRRHGRCSRPSWTSWRRPRWRRSSIPTAVAGLWGPTIWPPRCRFPGFRLSPPLPVGPIDSGGLDALPLDAECRIPSNSRHAFPGGAGGSDKAAIRVPVLAAGASLSEFVCTGSIVISEPLSLKPIIRRTHYGMVDLPALSDLCSRSRGCGGLRVDARL